MRHFVFLRAANLAALESLIRSLHNTAQEYTDRKIAAMKANLQYAQNALMAKRQDLQAITAALQVKIQQMQQRQQMQQGQ